jgi:hypothetical protein
MLHYIFLSLLGIFLFLGQSLSLHSAEIEDINVVDISVGWTTKVNTYLSDFVLPIEGFFFRPPSGSWWEGIMATFVAVAFQVKNFFIAIAIIFLIIGVLKLLFSPASDEDVKKWRKNIIWVSAGVFIMQIAFSVWNTFIIKDSTETIDSSFGYQIWTQIFIPIVGILQMLAAFGFMIMMVYAFYIIITGAGDEEKLKKGKSTVIYALVGFFLIKLPQAMISVIYGEPSQGCKNSSFLNVWSCEIVNQNLSGWVTIIAKIFNFFNGFLAILCVILIIYAGWLVLISWGDEEKLKKAKNIILYIIIGLIVLFASHAIFKFFILRG